MSEYVLEMRNISKQFPGVLALDDVDFNLKPGEVHVLLGENGAGKSTLIKILAGAYRHSAGSILVDGLPVDIQLPADAMELGIRIIYQELMVNDNITVTENIFQGREMKKFGLVDWGGMHKAAARFLRELDYDLNPHELVKNLGVAKKQIVEIVKATSHEATKIIVFDEPTASLSPKEIQTLFAIIRGLKAKGIGIVYISHRMSELYELGDRVTVLRDGRKIQTSNIGDVTPEELVTMVSGKKVVEQEKECHAGDEVILRATNLPTTLNREEGVSFYLRKGEILGVTGLVGAGKTELARSLCGIDPLGEREVEIYGRKVAVGDYGQMVREGIAYLSEDRRREGLVLMRSVADNITLPSMEQVLTHRLIDHKKEKELSHRYIDRLRIKTPSRNAAAMNLSGGNQQKVVVAKWLLRDTGILIFDEPTRGIDVGAKEEIYRIMFELTKTGRGIIVISSDIDEILRMADRVMVIKDGKKCVEFDDLKSVSKNQVLNYSFGVE